MATAMCSTLDADCCTVLVATLDSCSRIRRYQIGQTHTLDSDCITLVLRTPLVPDEVLLRLCITLSVLRMSTLALTISNLRTWLSLLDAALSNWPRERKQTHYDIQITTASFLFLILHCWLERYEATTSKYYCTLCPYVASCDVDC